MTLYFQLILGMAFALACNPVKALTSSLPSSPIPLEQGWTWIYEGKIEWTVPNSTNIKSAPIRWKMEVLDSLDGPGTRAAIVRGFPSELAWHEPGQAAGFTVLFAVNNRIYRLDAKDAQEAGKLARNWITHQQPLPPSTEKWLVLPLRKGSHWDGEEERQDMLYCWHVEEEKVAELHVEGVSPQQPFTVYTLGYRSLADHQLFEIAPCVGITRYVFIHHGTVASADVRLVSINRPPDSTRK